MGNGRKMLLACLLITALAGGAAAGMTKSGEGVSVWFDVGGSVGEPYATTVANGAKQAAHDTGARLTLVYSDWSPEKMLENFKNGLAAHPTGFVVMGHPGDQAFGPLIDRAFADGLIVTSVDTKLPALQAKYAARGFGFVGTDNWDQGAAMAREVIKRADLKAGDRIFVWGLKSLEGRGRRARAMLDVFGKAGLAVDYLEISPEVNKDAALGGPVLAGYLSAHPDCRAIVVDHGALTGQLGNFLKAAGIKPGQVYATGFSLTPATIAAIKSGYVQLVSEAQPYLMGYLSVLQIVETARYKFSGLSVDTGGGFISASNIARVAPLAEAGVR